MNRLKTLVALIAAASSALIGGCGSKETAAMPSGRCTLGAGFPDAGSDGMIPRGRLGRPLGTYLTIEGYRDSRGMKRSASSMLVDTVNGVKLGEPIGIHVENVKELPESERCILRGYETGRMIGLPMDVARAENLGAHQAEWQFYRYFLVTSVERPTSLKVEE